MENSKFIRVNTPAFIWDGNKNIFVNKRGSCLIRLDTILKINDLEKVTGFDTDEDRKGDWNGSRMKKFSYACIWTSIVSGQGINGVATTLLVDEESYHNVVKALGIENL